MISDDIKKLTSFGGIRLENRSIDCVYVRRRMISKAVGWILSLKLMAVQVLLTLPTDLGFRICWRSNVDSRDEFNCLPKIRSQQQIKLKQIKQDLRTDQAHQLSRSSCTTRSILISYNHKGLIYCMLFRTSALIFF